MIDPGDEEPRYPVRVVTSRTGLSADALRAWERRHGAVRPRRTAGGQRLYSERDLARLTLLRRATAAGHRIAEIARLDLPALEVLLEAQPSVTAAPPSDAVETLVAAALAAAERFDAAAVEATLRRGALAHGGTALVDRVVPALLREVGDRWHDGLLGPAQEHLATAAVRRVLAWVFDAYVASPHAPRIVVATPADELHELGALLVAAAAAEEGWGVVYLGASLPIEQVVSAATRSGARAVALSIVYERDAVGDAMDVARVLPAGIALFVGGAAAQERGDDLREAGVRLLADIPELRRALRALRASATVAVPAVGT